MRFFFLLLTSFLSLSAIGQRGKEHYNKALRNFENEPVSALYSIKLALKEDPENQAYYVLKGRIELSIDSEMNALESFEKALKLDPSYADAYVGRGEYYFQTEEFQESIDDYGTAIKLDPANAAKYYVQQALSFRFQYEYDKALESFERAIKIDKTYHPAYFHRAKQIFDENYEAAYKDYELAILYAPNDSIRTNYRFLRGEDEYGQAYFAEAYADFKAVLDTYPEREEVLRYLVDITYNLNYPDEGLTYCFELLEKPASEYDTYTTDIPFYTRKAADLYRQKGEYRKAIDYYYKCAELYNQQGPYDDFDAHYADVAFCEMKLGEYDKALTHIEQAMRNHIPGAEEYLLRAEIYGIRGENAKACSDLEKAAEEYPSEDEEKQIKALKKKYC